MQDGLLGRWGEGDSNGTAVVEVQAAIEDAEVMCICDVLLAVLIAVPLGGA